jgi:hypothetical protein
VLDDENVLDRLVRIRGDFGLRLGLSVTGPNQAATVDKAIAVKKEVRRVVYGYLYGT